MSEERWHWFDYILISVRSFWFLSRLIELFTEPAAAPDSGNIILAAILTTLAFGLPLAAFCIKKLKSSIMILVELLCSGLVFLFVAATLSDGLVYFCVSIFTVGYLSRRWTAAWALPAVMVPFVIKAYWGHSFMELADGMAFDIALLYGLGFCFGAMKRSLLRQIEMYRMIRQQNATLEHYSKQIERLTLMEERNRLSRELHDTVGHTMTTTVMGMNAVKYLIDRSPAAAKENLQELIDVTRIGLDEIRRHIHQIAPDKEDGTLAAVIEEIANDFARFTGTEVFVEVQGVEPPISEQVRLTLIRCLQESLTNAKRHGLADKIRINLILGKDDLCLIVKDNGQGFDQLTFGFGLQGMSERLHNVGGAFHIDSNFAEGTTVTCSIPLASNR